MAAFFILLYQVALSQVLEYGNLNHTITIIISEFKIIINVIHFNMDRIVTSKINFYKFLLIHQFNYKTCTSFHASLDELQIYASIKPFF